MRAGALLLLVSLAVWGGGGYVIGSRPAGTGLEGGEPGGKVTVFAAASLTESFRALADGFEEERPGGRVVLNLAGSQQLAAQIGAGAPADVFASADSVQMNRVVERSGRVGAGPAEFAATHLAAVTAPGNPREVRDISDLGREDLVVVMGAPRVPVGRYARRALRAVGVRVNPASLEPDVKQVLAKVILGEADVGIVYATDARAAGSRVATVPFPEDPGVVARYQAAILDGGRSAAWARRFVDYLLSPAGRRVLRAHGFRTPEGEEIVLGTDPAAGPAPDGEVGDGG